MTRGVEVAGVGLSRFGRHMNQTAEQLARTAILAAVADAEADIRSFDRIYCGNVFGGPVLGQRIATTLGIEHTSVINCENYCASGATALLLAYEAIATGTIERALVVGVEHLTSIARDGLQPAAGDVDTDSGFVMVAAHAMSARRYMADYGASRSEIASVAVKNRHNGALNPLAHRQTAVSLDDVLAAEVIASPLGKLDCSPISDGAAAAVLAASDGRRARKRVMIRGGSIVSGSRTAGRPLNAEQITAEAGRRAYEFTGIGPVDVDVIEMHDCFTIAEIVRLEALGVLPEGEGARLTASGHTAIDGPVPVNTSGGLLARGHPVGATGVAQICELSWQLQGVAGDRQVESAKVGLAYCKGGTTPGTDGASASVVVVST